MSTPPDPAAGPQPHPLRATALPAAIGAGFLLASVPFQAVFAARTIDRVVVMNFHYGFRVGNTYSFTDDLVSWSEAAKAFCGIAAPVLLGVAALLYARTVSRTITPEIRDREVIARAFRVYWGVVLVSLAALFVATLLWIAAVWI